MKKKILIVLALVLVAAALTGCSFKSTSTYTETTTDANGKTTTVTTQTVNDNGNVTTTTTTTEGDGTAEAAQPQMINAALIFDNRTDKDFVKMYFARSSAENWGPELLEDIVMAKNTSVTFPEGLTYSKDMEDTLHWDLKVCYMDGEKQMDVTFKGLNLTQAEDPEKIIFALTQKDDGGYVVNVR